MLRITTALLFAALLALPASFTGAQAANGANGANGNGNGNGDETIGTLILSDESAIQVLDLLEQMTGKIILRQQTLNPVKINFNSRGEISRADAILALESLLSLNGIMLTDMGGRFLKAVPAQNVNSHVPEMLISSTLDLPASQQVYAKLFQLDYLNSTQAAGTIITPLLSQNSSVVNFEKSNAILVTDALINLQRIENILWEADRPQNLREQIKFVKLNYVQAQEMQQRLETLIQGPLRSYLEGNTSVSADERTNQLIIVTPQGNLDVLMDVIASVDIDAAPLTRSEVFPLRQAKAEEVVPIIENIITGQQEGREQEAQTGRGQPGQNVPGANQPTQPPTAPPGFAAATTEASSSLQFSSFVGLSADERTNAIVAYGTDSDLRTLKELIEKIDIPLPQVRIEAIITEVGLTENQVRGIDAFGLNYDGTLDEYAVNILGSGFGIDGVFTPDKLLSLDTVVRAAESDSDVRVLSTPTIVVSHNEEGIINVSESRPIITASTSSFEGDNNTRSQIEFRDIGIKLTVTPLIGIDGSVQMTIEQTVDNLAGTTEIDGNEQPIIGRREATSTITVSDGEVIILGGLQENRREKTKGFFPYVGRLPLIRDVFGSNDTTFGRVELVIFIRPTVLRNPGEANRMTTEQIPGLQGADAVERYMETGSTGDTYMEGSWLEDEEPVEETPDTEPRSIQRLR